LLSNFNVKYIKLMYLFNQLLLILINKQILFATNVNKFILRNSIYILISTYILKVSRGKQIPLLVHSIYLLIAVRIAR